MELVPECPAPPRDILPQQFAAGLEALDRKPYFAAVVRVLARNVAGGIFCRRADLLNQNPLRCKVFRSSPRMRAASVLLPPAILSTREIWRFSRVSRSSGSGEVCGGADVLPIKERTSSASMSPSARETAPSMRF